MFMKDILVFDIKKRPIKTRIQTASVAIDVTTTQNLDLLSIFETRDSQPVIKLNSGNCTPPLPNQPVIRGLRPLPLLGINPDPLLSKGSPQESHPKLNTVPEGRVEGVSTLSLPLQPPASGCTCCIVQQQSFLSLHLPSLCFANGLSHIILHTHFNHWALGTVQEVIVAFVHVPPIGPPLSLFFLKEQHPLFSCHRTTAFRPRSLMTGAIVHENTIIALGSIATV